MSTDDLSVIKKGETSSSSNATFNQEATPNVSIFNSNEYVNRYLSVIKLKSLFLLKLKTRCVKHLI